MSRPTRTSVWFNEEVVPDERVAVYRLDDLYHLAGVVRQRLHQSVRRDVEMIFGEQVGDALAAVLATQQPAFGQLVVGQDVVHHG